MEEWIGERWHRLIDRAADRSFSAHGVALADVERRVGLLYRAAGGASTVRVVPAAQARIGGPRTWLQRLAGSGQRAALTRLDSETLAMPPLLAVFNDAGLNRELYSWLAVLAAVAEPSDDWIAGNCVAAGLALRCCPGMLASWQRLRAAQLAQRPVLDTLSPAAARAEAIVQAALRADPLARAGRGVLHGTGIVPIDVAPVWLWLQVSVSACGDSSGAEAANPGAPSGPITRSAVRRRTRVAEKASERAPMLLPSRAESLMTWSEHVPLDRASDDEDDGNATAAADDMEQLTLTRDGAAPAARVKFDLDLPSASADDLPLGAGVNLPEWDWKQQRLRADHCRVVTVMAQPGEPFVPGAKLRQTARSVRRRLEVLQAAPRLQRGCTEGDGIDIDAWVRHRAAGKGGQDATGEPAVYTRAVRGQRSLATLLLADLSLSTDAYANNEQRVVDVIRDALYVFGEALHATGDAFEMLGFSSVRRSHVRMQHLKGFDEAWGAAALSRVGAIKPGYYTRMGAAIRLATRNLQARHERQRLLLILTDGKPNDIDVYEGRWGLEDTRHAVQEARTAGLVPFCLSIDEEAHDYLPHLFGQQGWAHVQSPADLPVRLTAVYARLVQRAA